MRKTLTKLIRCTAKIEQSIALGKINPIDAMIEMRKILEREIRRIETNPI